jgi:hypothetical protein
MMLRQLLEYLLSLTSPAPAGGPLPLVQRSSKWPAVRDAHLKRFPTCAVCGSRANVTAHHLEPVHLCPSRELDAQNLLTLCEGPPCNDHLRYGHLGHWVSWNPNAVFDAATWRAKIKSRPK